MTKKLTKEKKRLLNPADNKAFQLSLAMYKGGTVQYKGSFVINDKQYVVIVQRIMLLSPIE